MAELPELIKRLLNADTHKKTIAAKSSITKKINELGKVYGASKAREIALTFIPKELEFLIKRLTPGYFYLEDTLLYGWYDDSQQVQAERLPVERRGDKYVVIVHLSEALELWKQRGFCGAVNLPTTYYPEEGIMVLTVRVPHENFEFWASAGYANACDIQYYWNQEGLTVSRSIIEHGFWKAYKWWPEAKIFWLKERPEWFTDLSCWKKNEPKPKPYDAIISPSSSEQWKASRLNFDE